MRRSRLALLDSLYGDLLPDERFGLGLSKTPVSRIGPPSGGSFSDPRLRGLDGGKISASSARYSVLTGDPYEAVAREQQNLGRRLPSSFDAPSAQLGRRSLTGKLPQDDRIYQDLRNDRSVYNAGSVAGMHETFAGGTGRMGSDPYNWDARHRFGYGQLGNRGTGYSERWDTAAGKERSAGRLTKTGSFDQAVQWDRPYLQLRARSDNENGPVVEPEGSYEGNALIRLTAGNFEDGQGVQRRTFWIGGGLVAVFDLQGWNNVRLNIREILEGTFVEFAWTREGLHGENRTLYFPETYTTAATSSPVPEGAYAVTIENPVPAVSGTTVTLEWIGQIGGVVFTFTEQVSDNSVVAFPRPYQFFGVPIPVLAPTFRIAPLAGAPATMADTIDICWQLRPI